MTEPVLRVDGIRKRFDGLQAVAGVSFEIAEGETYGLLGPNGAGKTTSISMIAGLLEKDAGEVHVCGSPMTTSSTGPKRNIGLVPQELAIYPDLSGRENLAFFGRLNGMNGSTLDDRIDDVLAVIGLADDQAKEYSGGMKRRLNIGIGLLHQPRLLILDEPTVGVDPQSRNAILESVEHLSGEGLAVLYTTHYMEEAERLCDRVGIIDQGVIQAEGDRRSLTALVGEKDRITVGTGIHSADPVALLASVDGVTDVTVVERRIEMLAEDASAVLGDVVSALSGGGVAVLSVEVSQPDLEAVFLHLTGKALRD